MNLVEALKKFNRKERYWLIRNALGPTSGQLGDDFRQKLNDQLGFEIPVDAWWAMDYHLDWLVGAFRYMQKPDLAKEVQKNTDALVRGHHQDVDFVVAFDQTLILIEAKGDTSWLNGQLNPKVDRLEVILADVCKPLSGMSVYFVLMSPKKSTGIERTKTKGPWPAWMLDTDSKLRWMPLTMAEGGQAQDFLKVIRCTDEAGTVGKGGSHWKIDRA